MKKVRWGVLGVAKIATEKVIPAMQRGERSEIVAIASRSADRARAAAEKLGIPRSHGSYEDLLADPEVDAVYNPLPNHEHVPWSIRAAAAGKHVLCEKPIALTAAEAQTLVEARDRSGVLISEAFMVRTHPQWLEVKRRAHSGEIGELRAIQGFFSYFNVNRDDIRNQAGLGGGALYDIGCYPVTTSRLIFDEEPTRVVGLIERDPEFGTDRLSSGMMDFPSGQMTFTCSTQVVPYQRMMFFGTKGRLEIQIPFNAPADTPCKIFVDDGATLDGSGIETVEIPVCNQYTVQGDRFSQAIQEGGEVATPLEDAVANMRVLEALFRSSETESWEAP